MTKQANKEGVSQSKKQDKSERRNIQRKIKRAQNAVKPNRKQQALLKMQTADQETTVPIESNDKLVANQIKAQNDGGKNETDSEDIVMKQIQQIEKQQEKNDSSYHSRSLGREMPTNTTTSKDIPFKKNSNAKDEALLIYFREVLKKTDVSSKMQQVYTTMLQDVLNSYDSDQLGKARKVFFEEQIAGVYKRYLQDRSKPIPDEFGIFSNEERFFICLDFVEQRDVVENYGYSLAREIFMLISRVKNFKQNLHLSNSQISFFRNTIHLSLEEIDQISLPLLEVYSFADLLPEMIEALTSKGSLTDYDDISKFWGFGQHQYPTVGLDKGVYRMCFVLKNNFKALSTDSLKAVLKNKFIYRNQVLYQLNQCGQTLQERIIHLLEEHTEPEESIKFGIIEIVKCFQKNPRILDFCKECHGKLKLKVSNMITLIDFLKNENCNSIASIMKGTYWEAYQSLQQTRSARCQDGMNSSVTLSYIEKLKADKPNFFNQYPALEQISQGLAITNSIYKHSAFQTAVACHMIQDGSCAILSRAGSGKTNMIFITCAYLLQQNIQFAVVVANEYLYHQMHHDSNLFFPDSNITVVTVDNVDCAFAKDKVLILDEADAMIDNFKLVLSEQMKASAEIGGMVGITQAKKLILLSATFEPHHKLFMRQVMGIKADRIHEFKNSAQLTSFSDPNELNCPKVAFQSLQGYLDLNGNILEKMAAEKPIICFIEVPDSRFETWLKKIAKKCGAPFYAINSIEEAKQYREALKDSRIGIITINTQFARGFDLKMAQDGYGIVVANGEGLKANQISQMFGRTNRSNGEPEGVLIMIDQKNKDSNQAWQMIKARDKSQPTHGYKNLAILAQYKQDLKGISFDLVKQAYMNDMWMAIEPEFNKKNNKIVQILKFPIIPLLDAGGRGQVK